MSSRLETEIAKKVCEYAQGFGILTPKIQVVSERGWPDRLFINTDGTHVWVEFKKMGEVPAPIQLYRMEQLAERNVLSIVIDNVEAGEDLVDAMVATRIPEESDRTPAIAGIRGSVPRPGTGEN